jgi:hypothetical protein
MSLRVLLTRQLLICTISPISRLSFGRSWHFANVPIQLRHMRPKLSPLRCGCVFSLVLSALWFVPQVTHAQAPSAQAVPSTQTERPLPGQISPSTKRIRFRCASVRVRPRLASARFTPQASQRRCGPGGRAAARALSAGTAMRDAVKTYRSNPEVLYAEPNYLVHALTGPNDPKFPQLWGLQKQGKWAARLEQTFTRHRPGALPRVVRT